MEAVPAEEIRAAAEGEVTPAALPETEAVPAGTVVLIRDGADGLEVLMLRRSRSGAFAGMWVFPGGRVEPSDAEPTASGDEIAAARRAAVREAEEEAGLVLDPATLVTLSHWLPPPRIERRYSTWFFLARFPGSAAVQVDGREIDEHSWRRPSDALAARDAGSILLAPPTWMTLDRLARLANVDAALALARARDPERFVTRIAPTAKGRVAFWPADAAWPDGDLERPGPRFRLWMLSDGWCFEGSAPLEIAT